MTASPSRGRVGRFIFNITVGPIILIAIVIAACWIAGATGIVHVNG